MKKELNKKINYQKIFKSALEITWRNKYLWWFGFLISFGGGFQFYFSGDSKEWGQFSVNNIPDEFIILTLIALGIFSLLALLISSYGISSLIYSANQITLGSSLSFRESSQEGRNHIWKIAGARIFFAIISLGLIITLFTPGVFLLLKEKIIPALILLLLGFFILVPAIILIFFLLQYSYFLIIINKLKVQTSILNSYNILLKNLTSSLIMGVLFLAISIIFAFILFGGVLLASILNLGLGFLLFQLFSTIGINLGIFTTALSLIFIFFLLNSIYNSFHHIVWLIFFREIAGLELKNEDNAEPKKELASEFI